MKKSVLTSALVATLGLAVAGPAAAHDDWKDNCSLKTLKGSYMGATQGFSVALPNGGFAPGAGISMVYFDGNGNVVTRSKANLGSGAQGGTVSGTYTLNANCSGSYTNTMPSQPSTTFAIEVSPSGDSLVTLIATTIGEPPIGGFAISSTLNRVSRKDLVGPAP